MHRLARITKALLALTILGIAGAALALAQSPAEGLAPNLLQEIVVPAILAIAGTVVAWLAARAGQWVKKLSEKENAGLIDKAVSLASRMALTIVTEIAQTTIADLKAAREDGKLTREEAHAALQKAIDGVWKSIGQAARDVLSGAAGSEQEAIDTYIRPLIEEKVATTQGALPASAPPTDVATREKTIAMARTRLGLQ